ncbi:MAG: hypothetical protein RMM17_10285 [Acidobacteriota bacterium]|nr:hypothetical protein [Blastocatellia bacterium]MDW8413057.1 hypothetical protein [Acidobacteriota bacterium]
MKNLQKRLVKLKDVSCNQLGEGQCKVTVSLICGRKTHIGERTGPDEADYRVMLAALSTIDALRSITKDSLQMELLFVERQQLELIGREVVMVLIDIRNGEDIRPATGACQVRGDVIETAARAVLDATNRVVEHCLK